MNHTSIEIQLMRKFTDNQCIRNLAHVPSEYSSIFDRLLGSTSSGTSTDTLFGQSMMLSSVSSPRLLSITQCTVQPSIDYAECCPKVVNLLPPFVLHKLDSISLVHLRSCYQSFLPNVDVASVPQLCRKHKTAQWWSERLNGLKSQGKKITCIGAYWADLNSTIANNCDHISVGIIDFFFSQCFMIQNKLTEILMAKVKWLQQHPDKNKIGKPVEIWYDDHFQPIGAASFIPLIRIHQLYITCKCNINDEQVLVISPIRKNIHIR